MRGFEESGVRGRRGQVVAAVGRWPNRACDSRGDSGGVSGSKRVERGRGGGSREWWRQDGDSYHGGSSSDYTVTGDGGSVVTVLGALAVGQATMVAATKEGCVLAPTARVAVAVVKRLKVEYGASGNSCKRETAVQGGCGSCSLVRQPQVFSSVSGRLRQGKIAVVEAGEAVVV